MRYYACKPVCLTVFNNKEKAINALFETSMKQQEVFFYSLDIQEIYQSLCSYYDSSYINKSESEIVIRYLTHVEKIHVHQNYIESEHLDYIFDFLIRMHPIWIKIDEKGQVFWIGLVNH